MTDEELERIVERWRKATAGPWTWIDRDSGGDWGHAGPDLVTVAEHQEVSGRSTWMQSDKTIISSWGFDADGLTVEDQDAIAIAAAPSDVAALIAEVYRLRDLLPE